MILFHKKIFLIIIGDLLDEVSEFVRSCCYFQNVLDQLDDHNSEDYIELHQFLSLGILGEKKAKVHLNDLTNLPSKFQDVFSPLLKHNKEMVCTQYLLTNLKLNETEEE